MTKDKELVLQNSWLSKLSLDSLLKFKAIVRYLLIIAYCYIGVYLLFGLENKFDVSKSGANKAGYKVMLIGINIYMAQIGLKRNAYAMNGKMFNLFMNMCLLGYATFIAIHFRDNNVKSFADMYKFVYYVYPILAFHALWYWGCAFMDRKTRPFLSKVMLYKSVTHIFMMLIMLMAHFLLSGYTDLIHHTGKKISLKDKDQVPLIFFMIFTTINMFVLFVFRNVRFHTKIRLNDLGKTLSLSMVFIIIIPLTIWYLFKIGAIPENSYEWITIAIPLAAVVAVFIYTVIKKSYLSSSKVYVTILSIAIVMTWTSKIWTTQQWPFEIRMNVSTAVTLVAVSLMVIMAFIKNFNMTKIISMGYIGVAFSIIIIVLYDWLITSYPAVYDLMSTMGIEVDDVLNTLLLTDCLFMVMSSIISWYRIQRVINKNFKRKLNEITQQKGVQNVR